MWPQFPANQPGPTTRFFTINGQEIWWYREGNPYVVLDPSPAGAAKEDDRG